MNWETILFLGDSITVGARTYLGFPEYAGSILELKLQKSWNILNHSKNGQTTIELARSIDGKFLAFTAQKPLLVVVLIGTNDIKQHTTVDEYRIALNQVVIKAKLVSENSNVLLLNIPLFPKGIMYPYSIEMNDSIKGYNEVIKELAVHHRVKTLTVSYNDSHFSDGVHLNVIGCKHVAESIANFVLSERGY